MTNRKTILAIGYYGDGNTGDEAVLTSMREGLASGRWAPEWIVPTSGTHPGALAQGDGVTSFHFQELGRLFDAVERADLVLLGGGGLLHDYQNPHSETMLTSEHFGLSYYCGIPWLAAQLGKPVMLYAVGVGPLLYSQSRELVRMVATSAQIVTVRDAESAALLEEVGVEAPSIEVTADAVWGLRPTDRAASEAWLTSSAIGGGRWLGVAVRNWDLNVKQTMWEAQLVEGVESFARRHQLGVLFVPFQHATTRLQDDLGLGKRLAARLSGLRTAVLERPCSPQEVAGVIGSCELIVAMRLHSLVFACMTGTPFVALDYDPKISHHAKMLEAVPPVIGIGDLTAQRLVHSLEEVWKSREPWRSRGRALAARMRRRARRNEVLALELLDRAPNVLSRSHRRRILKAARERVATSTRESSADRLASGPQGPAGGEVPVSMPKSSVTRRRLVRILAPAFFDDSGKTVHFGGAERYLIELVNLVRERGCEPEVIQRTTGKSWVRYYKDVRVTGLDTHGDLYGLDRAVREAGFPQALLTIHLAFQTAGLETPPCSIGISHGVFWDDPLCHSGSDFERHRDRIFRSLEALDLIVSVDTNTINWIRGASPSLAEKFVYVPNFVDLARFRPGQPRISSRQVILFPRRLVGARGFWLLAEIVPDLLRDHPELEFHFVGQASGEEEGEIRELVSRHPERVRWYFVPPEKMPEAYMAADIVVIPTEHSEGTSLSCLEAQASGRPVVVTNVGGLPDLVFNEFNGLLVEPNSSAIQAAIERLLTEPGLAEKLARGALETVRQFSVERWRDRWTDILAEYLPARSGRAPRHVRGAPITALFPQVSPADADSTDVLWGIAEDMARHGIDTFWVDGDGSRTSRQSRLHLVGADDELHLVAPLVFFPGPDPPPLTPGIESPETVAVFPSLADSSDISGASNARFAILFSPLPCPEEAGGRAEGILRASWTTSTWQTALKPIVRAVLRERRTERREEEQPSAPDGVPSSREWHGLEDREELAAQRARIVRRDVQLMRLRGVAAEKEVRNKLAILEIRRLADVIRDRDAGIAFLRSEVAARERALSGRIGELEESIAFLRSEVAARERQLEEREHALSGRIRELEADLTRTEATSEARDSYLRGALEELAYWENSKLGRLRRAASRVRAVPGSIRRSLGQATAPGTLLYAVARRALPRPLAQYLRRTLAPVARPDPLDRIPAGTSRPDALAAVPLGRYDVVVFSIIDWDFRFQRPQQLATQFGRHGHRVLYLSTTQFLAPGGPAWDLARKADRVGELRIRTARPLDIYGGRLEAMDLDALVDSFESLARDLSIGDAVCLVQIPFWTPLAERLRDRLGWRVVYDCMDEWTNFPGFGEHVLALEEGLVSRSDLTIVSADRLLGKWRTVAPRLVLAKNGIDGEHYRYRYGPNDLLAGAPRPVIGYYGALASWVDVPLLTKIAEAHPEATLILAGGHFDVDLSPIASRKNVRLLGQRPYGEMPKLLWSFDVCIIPFLVNDITEATNPVKFYEYLYGGKPVVAPALTELRPYEGLSYLARGHEEFLAQLSRALAEPEDDPRRVERRRVAEENDWARRYEAIDAGIAGTHPLVSVVVVTYGGLELTKACLESLARETWPRLELIVVDNGSSDGTPEYLKEAVIGGVRPRTILNAENRGFAAANNQGIAASRGEIVVLLNNDTVVPPGLIGRLVRHLERDPSIGLLCPTTNFCGNEARVEPDYTEISGLPAFAARRAAKYRGRIFDISVAALYCVAARRAVLETVGPLDEAYGVGMFEDDDLAVRMRASGFRVCCAEDAYVHHVGQGAFRKLAPEEYDRLWKKNLAYFEKKFGIAWKKHTPREGVTAVPSKVGMKR